MANHRAAVPAAILLFVSLVVAVALSGADARPTVRPDKADPGDGNNHPHERDAAVVAEIDPECDGEGKPNDPKHKHDKHHGHHKNDTEKPEPVQPNLPATESPYQAPDSVDHQELCSECEEPKTPPPPPPCNSCEEPKEPEMTCNKAHTVRDGETCYSMWQCAGLGQDDFLRFNPNICCDHLFVGQWVCLDATCDA